MDDLPRRATETKPRESSSAAGADDEEIRLLADGGVDEPGDGLLLDDQRATSKTGLTHWCGPGLALLSSVWIRVVEGMDRDHFGPELTGGLDTPLDCTRAAGRSVDTDEDSFGRSGS